MASSTAARLSTGSEPGRPRQTGQMLVFGSAPKLLRQPQNSLVTVRSSACTSRPITVSHRVVAAVTGRLPRRIDGGAPSVRGGGLAVPPPPGT